MNEMLALEKLDCIQQNLSSIEDVEGIFILDSKGKIVFANKNAKHIYRYKNEIRRLIGKKKVIIKKGNSEIVVYPIFEGNQTKFFFGIIRNISDMNKLKKYINSVKIFRESVAHYFFNPIIIAKGYLNLLLDKKMNADDKLKIEKVKTAIERIEAVVRNIVLNGEICE